MDWPRAPRWNGELRISESNSSGKWFHRRLPKTFSFPPDGTELFSFAIHQKSKASEPNSSSNFTYSPDGTELFSSLANLWVDPTVSRHMRKVSALTRSAWVHSRLPNKPFSGTHCHFTLAFSLRFYILGPPRVLSVSPFSNPFSLLGRFGSFYLCIQM